VAYVHLGFIVTGFFLSRDNATQVLFSRLCGNVISPVILWWFLKNILNVSLLSNIRSYYSGYFIVKISYTYILHVDMNFCRFFSFFPDKGGLVLSSNHVSYVNIVIAGGGGDCGNDINMCVIYTCDWNWSLKYTLHSPFTVNLISLCWNSYFAFVTHFNHLNLPGHTPCFAPKEIVRKYFSNDHVTPLKPNNCSEHGGWYPFRSPDMLNILTK